jgi:hypothetical protein
LPYLYNVTNQDPSIVGNDYIYNNQTTSSAKAANAQNKTRNLRIELGYQLGDHDLTAGVDNMYYNAYNEGKCRLPTIQCQPKLEVCG